MFKLTENGGLLIVVILIAILAWGGFFKNIFEGFESETSLSVSELTGKSYGSSISIKTNSNNKGKIVIKNDTDDEVNIIFRKRFSESSPIVIRKGENIKHELNSGYYMMHIESNIGHNIGVREIKVKSNASNWNRRGRQYRK